MKTTRLSICNLGLFVTAIASVSNWAHATQRFPSDIYYYLYPMVVPPEKHYYPPCSLCHVRGSTGPGTAQTPFALSAKARGLKAGDDTSLDNALSAMNREDVDSDGDGVPDIQELLVDTDPNTPADVSLTGQAGPNSGCGGGHKSSSSSSGKAPAAAFGLLLLAALRRRYFRK
jgi:MYXO-CTERM domain-containing protein